MKKILIEITKKYHFGRFSGEKNKKKFYNSNNVLTTFVHEGKLILSLFGNGKNKEFEINSGQGFILTPNQTYFLENSEDVVAYSVFSKIKNNSDIFETLDYGDFKEEKKINNFKIIENPKKVIKPWGHELWISWIKDYHVLKQIGMNAGKRSSLQFHRKKLETNYLESGKAEVIEGYKLNINSPEEIVQESSKGINFDNYKKIMKPGNHWTSYPGVVHRVISLEDYIAYEVSTTELDDVIRLQDDSQRNSGRIISEHLRVKNG